MESESVNNTDDAVLLGDSKENIQRLLNKFNKVYERRKLKGNVGKSKLMVYGKVKVGNN